MLCLTRVLLFSTLAAAVATSMQAQRGGFAGRPLAPSSTALGAGALSAVPSATARSTAPARVSVFTPGFRGSGFHNGNRSRGYYGRNSRLPFAYWVAPYYYGPFDYGDSSYDNSGYAGAGYDMPDDPNAQAAVMAQQALIDQVQRLSAQMAQLQNGQQQPAPPVEAQQEQLPPQIPVTLVLRNGQQLQVQNYAVMDQTFWDFSRQPVRKIPIASIDVAASTKATESKGGEFPQLPTP